MAVGAHSYSQSKHEMIHLLNEIKSSSNHTLCELLSPIARTPLTHTTPLAYSTSVLARSFLAPTAEERTRDIATRRRKYQHDHGFDLKHSCRACDVCRPVVLPWKIERPRSHPSKSLGNSRVACRGVPCEQ